MGIYRVQVALQLGNGNPADVVCNNFHVQYSAGEITPATPGVGTTIRGEFEEFYGDLSAAGMASNNCYPGSSFKMYNLADPPNSAPAYSHVYVGNPYIATNTDQSLPNEVAICISYEAIAAPGTVRARRRGRVYIGTISTQALSDHAWGPSVEEGLADGFRDAFLGLHSRLDVNNIELGVYSPTDELFLSIQRVWVDDAFDTQRRRGIAPTQQRSGTT